MNSERSTIKRAIVSEKGQVTIPKQLRDRLGLAPGTVLEFRAERGRLIAEKSPAAADPVLSVTGVVQVVDVDGYLDEIRGAAE